MKDSEFVTILKHKFFPIDLGNYRKTVFLAGSGRSGTTWVMELINFDGSYRTIFEPFHRQRAKLPTEWNNFQYLSTNNKDKTYFETINRILEGQIKYEWVNKFNKKLVATKRIVKSIRANFLLMWIKKNFPEIPIILLLRHPCPVANSKMRFNWGSGFRNMIKQDELVKDYLHPYVDAMLEAETDFEKHIFAWCSENYVPLKQFNEGDIHVLFYENLCVNPLEEFKKMLSFLGKSSAINEFDIFAKPSAMSTKRSAINTGRSLTETWREDINQEQINKAVEILRLFGLDKIYNAGSLPLVSGDEALKILK